MSAHTPGPWTAHAALVKSRLDVIARCGKYLRGTYILEEAMANARLIAAAPAVVEALRTLADYSEAVARGDDDATPTHLRCISAGMMAEAVIAARAALKAAGVE